MLELVWEPDAADQLNGILDYIAARNRTAAERFERAFYEKLEMACKFPAIGRPGRVAGPRQMRERVHGAANASLTIAA